MSTPQSEISNSKYPPGVWDDGQGALHFDIPAILKNRGIPVTPANEAAMTKELKKAIAKQWPMTKVVTDPIPGPTN